MTDKNPGFKNIRLIPTNGYSSIDCDSTIELNSQTFVNLNADTVGISTNVTIGGEVASDLVISPGFAVGIGSTIPTATLDVNGNVKMGGTLSIQQTTEVLNTKTGAGSTVIHDYSTGSIWYHSGISTDFKVNLTNVPTTENRTITVTLFLNQGGTGYYANELQIDGNVQTIKWANNATPIPSTNKLDVQSFTLIRTNPGTGVTWVALGQLINYN